MERGQAEINGGHHQDTLSASIFQKKTKWNISEISLLLTTLLWTLRKCFKQIFSLCTEDILAQYHVIDNILDRYLHIVHQQSSTSSNFKVLESSRRKISSQASLKMRTEDVFIVFGVEAHDQFQENMIKILVRIDFNEWEIVRGLKVTSEVREERIQKILKVYILGKNDEFFQVEQILMELKAHEKICEGRTNLQDKRSEADSHSCESEQIEENFQIEQSKDFYGHLENMRKVLKKGDFSFLRKYQTPLKKLFQDIRQYYEILNFTQGQVNKIVQMMNIIYFYEQFPFSWLIHGKLIKEVRRTYGQLKNVLDLTGADKKYLRKKSEYEYGDNRTDKIYEDYVKYLQAFYQEDSAQFDLSSLQILEEKGEYWRSIIQMAQNYCRNYEDTHGSG